MKWDKPKKKAAIWAANILNGTDRSFQDFTFSERLFYRFCTMKALLIVIINHELATNENYSCGQLAYKLGLSPQYISNIESELNELI